MAETYNIIRPVGLKPLPDKYEEKVAELCAKWFCSDIAFVLRSGHTTPDIKVLKTDQFWEIKNIKSDGKHAIEDNLRKANKQANNIIISLLRSPDKDYSRVESRIRYILKSTNVKFAGVLLATKTGKIIDIKPRP